MLTTRQVEFIDDYITTYQDSLVKNLNNQAEFLHIANFNKKINNHTNSHADVFYFNLLAKFYKDSAESDAAIIEKLTDLTLNPQVYTFTTIQLHDHIDQIEKSVPYPTQDTLNSIMYFINTYVYHKNKPIYNPHFPTKLQKIPGKLHTYKPVETHTQLKLF